MALIQGLLAQLAPRLECIANEVGNNNRQFILLFSTFTTFRPGFPDGFSDALHLDRPADRRSRILGIWGAFNFMSHEHPSD